MGKEKKEKNPADAFRKEQRKKELVKAKKDKAVVNEVRSLLNNPDKIDLEIQKAQKQSDDFKLDKSLKDRIKELQMMKEVALKKQQIMLVSGKRSDSSHDSEQKLDIITEPKVQACVRPPQDSVYYHPIYNQSGAPPPGQPMLYKSIQPSLPSRPIMGGAHIPPPPRPIMGGSHIPPPPPLRQHVAPQLFTGLPPPPPPPPQLVAQQFPQTTQQHWMTPPPLPVPGNAYLHQQHLIQQHQLQMQHQQMPQFQVQPQQPLGQQRPVDRSHIAVKREHSGSAFDPLDPSASGYTERFGVNSNRKQKDNDNSAERSDRNNQSMVVSNNLNVNTADKNKNSEISGGVNTCSAVAEVVTEKNIIQPTECSPTIAEELMRRRFVVPEQTGDSEVANVALPSAEDLMQRRFQAMAEDAVAHDVEQDDVDVDDDDDDDDCIGPSRPPAVFDYDHYYSNSLVDNEEHSDLDTNTLQEPVVSEKVPEDASSSFSSSFVMPVLNLRMEAPPQNSLMMGLLGEYGDDDEEDEDEDNNNDNDKDSGAVNDVNEAEKKSVEATNSSDQTYLTTFNSGISVHVPSYHSVTDKISNTTAYPSTFQLPGTIASSVNNTFSNSTNISSTTMLKGPRIVKTDSAVTALVPNVLKIKRQLQKQQVGLQPAAKVSRPTVISTYPSPNINAQLSSTMSTAASSVEDAYNSFLSEIGEL